ncbi:MAG: hypothetical protein H8F28_11015 [Fibrella sp.]|nr:hypothetical protein [Armatimonadota bacterium]
MNQSANVTLSQILRFDSKTNSYKLALIRAINDVALAYPTPDDDRDVLIPLKTISTYWVAYFWAFMSPQNIIYQGARNLRDGKLFNDLAFRDGLTALRKAFDALISNSKPSDGFYLISEMQTTRRRNSYSADFIRQFDSTVTIIGRSVLYPIQYAGQGGAQWNVFPRPKRAGEFDMPSCHCLPGVTPETLCLKVPAQIWQGFKELSLWIEALCTHEWCLFSETVKENQLSNVSRGDVYNLLTDRPGNRRPLSWERNHVDVLIMEGNCFVCPWSLRKIDKIGDYALDHLIPIALYPINDLWNLLPSDHDYNSHVKRAKLPSQQRLITASRVFEDSYSIYSTSRVLGKTLVEDSERRFLSRPNTPSTISAEVVKFIERISLWRSVETF